MTATKTTEPKTKTSSTRLDLPDVVDELTRRFHSDDDWPADHRCAKPATALATYGVHLDANGDYTDGTPRLRLEHVKGKSLACVHVDELAPAPVCEHLLWNRLPLLARLQMLVLPGNGRPATEDKPKHVSKRAAPAPWAAPAAELLDEIHRGALELNAHARRVLGYGPLQIPMLVTRIPFAAKVTYVPALADAVGARAALRDLLKLQASLAAGSSTKRHHLAVTFDDQDKPRDGLIAQRIRQWHRKAMVMTGHSVPWPRLAEIPNPHVGIAWCDLRDREVRRERAWTPARCPYCNAASLRQNPITGAVVCTKPSCRDDQGRRHEWDVDELRRLGLILESA